MPRNYCEYREGILAQDQGCKSELKSSSCSESVPVNFPICNPGQDCANGVCINTNDYYRCECQDDFVPISYGTECVPKDQAKRNLTHANNDVCNNKNPCVGSVCGNRHGGSFWCECKQVLQK